MLSPDRPIETERLILRPFHDGDLGELYAYQSLPEVARFLYWDARDLEEALEALRRKVTPPPG